MSFYTFDPVWCQNCPALYVRGIQVGVQLICTVRNYSGCSVDFGECPECGKRFQVSYKVNEVIEINEGDETIG